MSVPRQKPEVRLEVMDGELLLYHPEETRILYCNQTASLIWGLCDGQRTTEEVIALLREAYPEAAETMAADVQATLRELARHGAIEFI